MKKIILFLIFILTVNINYAQNHEPYSKIYISFLTLVDELQKDKNGNIWIETFYSNFHTKKIKIIYLKNDNDEIITLKCNHTKRDFKGYEVSKYIGVYKDYYVYSYFKLNKDIIEKLKNSKIKKIRVVVNKEIIEKEVNIDFSELLIKLNNVFELTKNKEDKIKEIKNNPLKDF